MTYVPHEKQIDKSLKERGMKNAKSVGFKKWLKGILK